MNLLAVGVAAVVLVGWAWWLWKRFTRGLPGPVQLPWIGNLQVIWNHHRIHDYLTDLVRAYKGETFALRAGSLHSICVSRPENLDHVLNKNFKNYVRGSARRQYFHELLGDGIFTSDGREWLLHRKLAKPLFRSANIEQMMVPLFKEHILSSLFKTLDAAAEGKQSIDLCQTFLQFTMATFLELGLASADHLTAKERLDFAKHFDFAQATIVKRVTNPFWRVFTPSGLLSAIEAANALIHRVLEEKKKESPEELRGKTDILSQFLLLTDDDGKPLTDEYLRDVFMNFLLAGRDTTAAVLTWTFYCLCQNPSVEKNLLSLIDQTISSSLLSSPKEQKEEHFVPSFQQLSNELLYARQVLSETLRLYPSVPLDGRKAVRADRLPDGTLVLPDDEVFFSAYAMGRLEQLWKDDDEDDPMKYRPERWTEERIANMPKGIFPAFFLGPQTCLGKEMAYVEAAMVLCAVLKRYKICLLPGEENKTYVTSIVMLPRGGLHVTVQRR
ncbi:Cytochrome P450 family 94 subfamily D polypeptide 2 [Balamuthia mandrillaris]